MNNETKLQLLKFTDSYWTLLPEEVREVILLYKESQELIEWCESFSSRALCKQIKIGIETKVEHKVTCNADPYALMEHTHEGRL